MSAQYRSFEHAISDTSNVIYFNEALSLIDFSNDMAECDRRAEAWEHDYAWRMTQLSTDPYLKVYDSNTDYPAAPHLRIVGEFDPDWAA